VNADTSANVTRLSGQQSETRKLGSPPLRLSPVRGDARSKHKTTNGQGGLYTYRGWALRHTLPSAVRGTLARGGVVGVAVRGVFGGRWRV